MVSGLFDPGIFALRSESSQWEPSLPGMKVPGNFCDGELNVPGISSCSRERMLPGTFVPGIVSYMVRDAAAAVKVNPKNM